MRKDRKHPADRERRAAISMRIAMAAGLIPGGALLASVPEEEHQVPLAPAAESSLVSAISRTSALWSNPHWLVIKDIWRSLDAVDPGNDGYGGQLIEWDSANALREKLYRSMEGLLADAPELRLDTIEIHVLRNLCENRIDLLSWGSSMPMTRMMPPPISGQVDDVVYRIESRIDLLLDLRERGLIEGPEMTEAFTLLVDEVDLYAALQTVSSDIGYSGYSELWGYWWPEDIDSIAVSIDSLRQQTLASIESAGESYDGQLLEITESFDAVTVNLRSVRSRFPALNELLMDLELF